METVRAVVAYGRELEQKHGKQINFTITTNGVGLTDAAASLTLRDLPSERFASLVVR